MNIIETNKCDLDCECGVNITLGCDYDEFRRLIDLMLNENLISVCQYDDLKEFMSKKS